MLNLQRSRRDPILSIKETINGSCTACRSHRAFLLLDRGEKGLERCFVWISVNKGFSSPIGVEDNSAC